MTGEEEETVRVDKLCISLQRKICSEKKRKPRTEARDEWTKRRWCGRQRGIQIKNVKGVAQWKTEKIF